MVKEIIRFAERTTALDDKDKLKLILFAAGVKPVTYVHLRIKKNLHDKHRFEKLLHKNGIFFTVSRAKGFEEITGITNNAAQWHFTGTWYGYDLFHTSEQQRQFKTYKRLLAEQKHAQADKLAGKLYDYPESAITAYINAHRPKQLEKKYTYYQYYKRLHDIDRAMPFITHVPASPTNKDSKKQNEQYKRALRTHSPTFYAKYTKKRTYNVPVIVDVESTVPGIWKNHQGHDYVLITAKPIEKNYWLISWLTRKTYPRGTILDATITMQHDYATVTIHKELGKLPNFHHERHFKKL